MKYVAVVLLALLVAATAAAMWRFTRFRNAGAPALFRRLPAREVHGWRHGILRYRGEVLQFFKLRSLSLSNDLALDRRDITLKGLRECTDEEREIMPGISKVLHLGSPAGDFEFAGAPHVQMALVSWVEAAPDRRQVPRGQGPMAQQGHQAPRPRGKL
ncbi:DUF2550 domain-containing protein [Corynebacterium sp. UBA2622]|uniref:DUF2550 domain-containing protein n=1 Tax=Corynebacterium sp. UBA2622 TaxID=1946393 RepID=UPI0025BB3775|nr:DUF2550 domain-containing protein [Corynebacterium sp. UBA2622]